MFVYSDHYLDKSVKIHKFILIKVCSGRTFILIKMLSRYTKIELFLKRWLFYGAVGGNGLAILLSVIIEHIAFDSDTTTIKLTVERFYQFLESIQIIIRKTKFEVF